MTSHLDPTSPLWDPHWKDVSRGDSLSGVCADQSCVFLTVSFLPCIVKFNTCIIIIIRFSTEDVSASSPEKKSKPATPTATRRHNSADWLGLKANDAVGFLEDAKETKTSAESPKAPPPPLEERNPSLTGSHATAAAKVAADTPAPTITTGPKNKSEVSKSPAKEKEKEDDWLAGALSRKKTLAVSDSEAKTSQQEDSLGLGEYFSGQVPSQAPKGREDTHMCARETR